MTDAFQLLGVSLSYFVNSAAFVIQQSIFLLNISFDKYPQITGMVVTAIFIYIVYTMIMQTIKMVYRMLVNVVKMIMCLLLIFTGAALYLRGYTFFTQDMQFVYNSVKNIDIGNINKFELDGESFQTAKESLDNLWSMVRFFGKQLLNSNER